MRFVLSAARNLHNGGIMLGKLPRSQRRAALFDLAVPILTSCLQKSSMSLSILYPIPLIFARGQSPGFAQSLYSFTCGLFVLHDLERNDPGNDHKTD